MCGIIGFCGNQLAAPIVFEGLTRVEYRGYDSAGISSIDNNELVTRKGVGKLNEVEAQKSLSSMPGNLAIGHTRWATHGGVTTDNAHPHCDCNNNIAVVHNGTIDNYQQLRNELAHNNHKLISETDTEIIPHLIEDEMKKGASLQKAISAIVPKLKGSYAFLAIAQQEPDKIIGIRKESPLAIGKSSRGIFAGSDALVFPDDVSQIYALNDDDLVVLKPDQVEFFDTDGNKLDKKAKDINLKWAETDKQGHKFFMLKEIFEQPQVLENSLGQDKDLFNEIALDVLRAGQVIITACGTSRYAAIVGKYLISKIGKKYCDVIMSSEFHYFDDSVDRNTVVIAVSQSGETADVIEGVKRAKAAGAHIISIVNRPMSLLADLSHSVIYLNCGPELCVAATKSFLSQLLIFYLLSFSMVNSFDKAVNILNSVKEEIVNTIKWNNDSIKKITLFGEMLAELPRFYLGKKNG